MRSTSHSQQRQIDLPMDMPPPAKEGAMRALFEQRWARWHRCKTFEEAVADPITRRLLELAVVHGARHAVQHGRGRR